jgi:hypothetical protein
METSWVQNDPRRGILRESRLGEASLSIITFFAATARTAAVSAGGRI